MAAWALTVNGVRRDDLLSTVARIVHTEPCHSNGIRPWTPRAKRAIESAVGEARALGYNYVSAEHLLLGLLQVTEGVALQTLQELGVDTRALKRTVLGGLEQL